MYTNKPLTKQNNQLSPLNKQGVEIIFFPDRSQLINDLILQAKSEILISRQAPPNLAFCDAAINAHKRGVNLKMLLTDLQYFLSNSTEQISSHHNVASDIVLYSQTNTIEKEVLIQHMINNGFTPQYINHDKFFLNHSKFMIIDSEVLYIGSAPNDSTSRLDIGVLSRNPKHINFFRKLFYLDLNHIDSLDGSNSDIAVAPLNMRKIIEDLLNGASQSIDLFFPIVTDDDSIMKLLLHKMQENVRLNILCSPTIFSDGKKRGPDHECNLELIKHGAKIQISDDPIIHCRCIIIDGNSKLLKKVFIGSCNLRASSLDRSREVGMVIQASYNVDEISRRFQSIWAQSYKYV
jgi:phosphatidylserine/phosphatidylglycerophosphate/cardiolipin synthase-like enzyme